MSANFMQVRNLKLINKNTLVAGCEVVHPSGVILYDVLIFRSGDRMWATPGSRPQIDKTGQHMVGPNGKRLYVPVVGFVSREVGDAWSERVLAAVRAQHPGLLDLQPAEAQP
jgi:hypothetical protein